MTRTIAIGDTIRYRVSDSINIREAVVLGIEIVPATYAGSYVIVPAYAIYIARDIRNGWVHRLTVKDLR